MKKLWVLVVAVSLSGCVMKTRKAYEIEMDAAYKIGHDSGRYKVAPIPMDVLIKNLNLNMENELLKIKLDTAEIERDQFKGELEAAKSRAQRSLPYKK